MSNIIGTLVLPAVLTFLVLTIVIVADAIILKDVFLHGKLSTRTIGLVLVPLFVISGILYAIDGCGTLGNWVMLVLSLMPIIRVGVAIKTKTLRNVPFITFAAIFGVAVLAFYFIVQYIEVMKSIPAIL